MTVTVLIRYDTYPKFRFPHHYDANYKAVYYEACSVDIRCLGVARLMNKLVLFDRSISHYGINETDQAWYGPAEFFGS